MEGLRHILDISLAEDLNAALKELEETKEKLEWEKKKNEILQDDIYRATTELVEVEDQLAQQNNVHTAQMNEADEQWERMENLALEEEKRADTYFEVIKDILHFLPRSMRNVIKEYVEINGRVHGGNIDALLELFDDDIFYRSLDME